MSGQSYRARLMSHLAADTALGDLARDLRRDPCAADADGRPLADRASIRAHILTNHAPCKAALAVLQERP